MRKFFSPKTNMDAPDPETPQPQGQPGQPQQPKQQPGGGNGESLPEAAANGAPEMAAQDNALSGEVARLEKELAEHREHLLRRQAEFDNYRRRSERERAELRVHTTMEVILKILPVLDSLELALKNSAASPDDIRKGVVLVEKQLRETLEKMGITRIQAAGQPFDPRLHHAVDTVETSEHPDHTVIDVYQPGYLFKDRLLRPAMVRVASNPKSAPTENASQ